MGLDLPSPECLGDPVSAVMDFRVTRGGKTVARFDSLYYARTFVQHMMDMGEWGEDWGPKIRVIARNGKEWPTYAAIDKTVSGLG